MNNMYISTAAQSLITLCTQIFKYITVLLLDFVDIDHVVLMM